MKLHLNPGLTALVFLLLSATALCLSGPARGAIEVYEFETTELEQRFKSLTSELRCPKCQNQNIAASNAPIADDMREQVYLRLKQGQTNDEIVGAMVERFGEFVQYRPPLNNMTFLLWFGPLMLGVIGLILILIIVRRSKSSGAASLSVAERARLDALLDKAASPDVPDQPSATDPRR